MRLNTKTALICLWLYACDSSIAPDDEHEEIEQPSSDADAGGSAEKPPEGDEARVHEIELDASDMDAWVYLDLEHAQLVKPKAAASSDAWDLAFRRFAIAMNGGVSGKGGVEVAVVAGRSFAELGEAPTSGYLSDAKDSVDEDEDPDYVMSTGETGWYDYDPTSHVLTPRAHAYVVRTVERNLFKLEVVNYYNEAGSSGYPTLRFQLLARSEGPAGGDDPHDAGAEPDADTASDAGESSADASIDGSAPNDAGPDAASGSDAAEPDADYLTLTLDASSSDQWVYVSACEGVVPGTGGSWDLAFQRTRIQTNSGTSGAGMGGARLLEGSFGEVHEAPAGEGFAVDEELPIPVPPGSGTFSGNPVLNGWYDYDFVSHTVTPKDQAYYVRTHNGAYAKLRITTYDGGVFTIDLGLIE